MTRYTGKDLYVSFNSTDLSGDFRLLDVIESVEAVDVIVATASYRDKQPGRPSWGGQLTMLEQAGIAGTAIWGAVSPGTRGTLEWGPEGTASNKPRHYAEAMVSSRKRAMPYENVGELSVEFDGWGTATDTIY